MNRSVTTPVPRSKAPPSPDFTSNLDCAFPPFPSKSTTPRTTKPRPRDRLEPTYQHRYAEPSPLFAPLSPRTNGGENVSRRMDTIAPGPFDGTSERRPSTAGTPTSPAASASAMGHKRNGTQDSIKSSGSAMQQQRASNVSTGSRSSAYSNRSIGLPSSPKPGMRRFTPPPLPSTSEQTEGIDAFLDRLQNETNKSSYAAKDDSSNVDHVRPESRERKGPPPRPRRPSSRDLLSGGMASFEPTDFMSTSAETRTHSRHGSATGSTNDHELSHSLRPPPLLTSRFGSEAPLNPLHTPSDSGLSDDSYASSGFRSIASSRSSPPGSIAGHSREASKLSRTEHVVEEETYERTASPESYADLPPPRRLEGLNMPNVPAALPRSLSPNYSDVPESPMDPAIQIVNPNGRRPKELLPQGDNGQVNGRNPIQTQRSETQEPEPRRLKTSSKGNCRGCSEPIVGKSVKDSSGRLTGRYHKQCFVCRTCADPFPTAEFYVFENSPYCEHHYHRLNDSLCKSCNRGIEGQYLETDMRQKFHPKCFACTTCRIVLRDGYFEVGGQRYCDRHAQSAAAPPQNHLGPGGYKPRNLQKRGTRLMMMA